MNRPAECPGESVEACVIAVDPGSHKCGIAVVTRAGRTAYSAIWPTAGLPGEVVRLTQSFRPIAVLVGDGTGSRPVRRMLEEVLVELPIVSVDERHSSEAARARCLRDNPPRGLVRLMPPSLRTPERPCDDYVAVILGERYWECPDGESGVRDGGVQK